jgi:hypothetical protein
VKFPVQSREAKKLGGIPQVAASGCDPFAPLVSAGNQG